MAVTPVKVRVKGSDKYVVTYDNGSNSSFCTDSLKKQLRVKGQRTKKYLSTLERKNSTVVSNLVRDLVISDLDENEYVSLPILYTRPKIPVSSDDIPTHFDIDQWPHLQGVFIPRVHAEVGLLIATDVPEAPDPLEIRDNQEGGPYATRTRIGWAVNCPFGRHRRRSQISGFFVRVDEDLHQRVKDFYNRDFTESIVDDRTEMSQDELRFMHNAEETVKLKDGHHQIYLPFKDREASLSSFCISRCLMPEEFGQVASSQLHHFPDGSEDGYGSVSYLRLVNEEGNIHCALLFGKSRVTPLKAVTIPRLELSAATMSVRHARMLKREIEIPLSMPSMFWSDSMSVLRYIKNDQQLVRKIENRFKASPSSGFMFGQSKALVS
ncbi:hypothetical protein P5673_018931 [Acropora cervicornis]|uniref:Uncharacterized protein n=1 Tax=Acropora cervicornis TaxID=6130 RepID=A0AAD9V2C5_ACRCE|nr:hypothetical protein P5673_018931 [Acropora cervicornis]